MMDVNTSISGFSRRMQLEKPFESWRTLKRFKWPNSRLEEEMGDISLKSNDVKVNYNNANLLAWC